MDGNRQCGDDRTVRRPQHAVHIEWSNARNVPVMARASTGPETPFATQGHLERAKVAPVWESARSALAVDGDRQGGADLFHARVAQASESLDQHRN